MPSTVLSTRSQYAGSIVSRLRKPSMSNVHSVAAAGIAKPSKLRPTAMVNSVFLARISYPGVNRAAQRAAPKSSRIGSSSLEWGSEMTWEQGGRWVPACSRFVPPGTQLYLDVPQVQYLTAKGLGKR